MRSYINLTKTAQRKYGGAMQELIGKIHGTESSLPKKLAIKKNN